MAIQYPDLVSEYIEYVEYKSNFEKNAKLDLSTMQFIYPTTLLPLSELIIKNNGKYSEPTSYPVANYIKTMLDPSSSNFNNTYAPIVALPPKYDDSESYMQKIFDIQQNPNEFGGESAFKYFVSELVDNIYQHSQFTRALIMGQRYTHKGFIDLSFYDNGITIPQIFREKGFDYEASSAIREALNGTSTKDDDRGFGLRTSLNLFTNGLHGKFFIVSGNGAVHINGDVDNLYKLVDNAGLNGTLITVRIPQHTSPVNIYDYVE